MNNSTVLVVDARSRKLNTYTAAISSTLSNQNCLVVRKGLEIGELMK